MSNLMSFATDDQVQIPPGSWAHQIGWIAADVTATGTVTKVTKGGKVSVRVNEIRNKLKRGCRTTMGQARVCQFSAESLEKKP